MNQIGRQYLSTQPDSVISISKNVISIAEKLDQKKVDQKRVSKGKAMAYHNLGIYYYIKGDYGPSIENLEKALKHWSIVGDKQNLGDVYYNLGLCYQRIGNINEGLDFMFKALDIRERLSDSLGIANSYHNIGSFYNALKNYPLAESYFLKAVELSKKINSKRTLASCYNTLGNTFLDRKKYSQSEMYYLKALEINKELKNNWSVARNLGNLGNLYIAKKEYEKALEYFNQVLEIDKLLNDKTLRSEVYVSQAIIFENIGKYNEALTLLEKVTASEKSGDFGTKITAYQRLSSIYEKTGNKDKALNSYKTYSDLKDSLLNTKNFEELANIRSQFEIEKRTREQELIAQQKEIAQKARLEKQKLLTYSGFGGALLMLVLCVMAVKGYRDKQKANNLLSAKNIEIEHQKHILEEQNDDITNSIRYAKRIQLAILPTTDFKNMFGAKGFIFYKPKDIVSGDFYWLGQKNNKVFVAAVDSTGHGVPGAFMSIVGYNSLSHALEEKESTSPAVVLNKASEILTDVLRQKATESSIRDGMDIALCSIDLKDLILEYAGAYNPMWLVRNGALLEYKADKQPVGLFIGEESKQFNNHTVNLCKGDMIYLFTDGFADQFGGEKGKKFKYKNFEKLLLEISDLSPAEQSERLGEVFENWSRGYQQVDDVCVIGIKV